VQQGAGPAPAAPTFASQQSPATPADAAACRRTEPASLSDSANSNVRMLQSPGTPEGPRKCGAEGASLTVVAVPQVQPVLPRLMSFSVLIARCCLPAPVAILHRCLLRVIACDICLVTPASPCAGNIEDGTKPLGFLPPSALHHIRGHGAAKRPTAHALLDSDDDDAAEAAAGLADGRDGVNAQHWALRYVHEPGVRTWSFGEQELLAVCSCCTSCVWMHTQFGSGHLADKVAQSLFQSVQALC
jgi:hypothetical protein